MDLENILNSLIIIIAVLWFIAFILMVILQWREEIIYAHLRKEKDAIKKQPIAMCYIEQQLKEAEDKYSVDIEDIERHKQFIRDVMPFIRK